MLRSLAVGLSLFGVVQGSFADPPTATPAPHPAPVPSRVVNAGTPVAVQQAPAAMIQQVPSRVVSQPCDCQKTIRPQRLWLIAGRPIVIDCKDRYEPRIRDIRFAPMSSTLPGSGLGAPDTLFVLPPYRDGYIRLFETR